MTKTLVALAFVLTAAAVVGAGFSRPAGSAAIGASISRPAEAAAQTSSGNVGYDGRLAFVRLRYANSFGGFGSRRGGRELPWAHDYPTADIHMMKIINDLTTTTPHVAGSNIFSLDDPELMKYPVAYLSEPGGWHPNETEIGGLRNYLLKGGFVIVDDFDNSGGDLQHFYSVMQQVLPNARIVDVPETHPIFDSFFKVDLRLMERSEGNYGGAARYLGIYRDNDPRKRLMMIVNLNLDVGEHWQWSTRGFSPVPSNEAYKLGVNYLIYALTH